MTAVDDVDLTLRQGEILGLIGPNGAGKTTLVNVLSGFQRPTTGSVMLDGRDITTWTPAEIARSGLVRTFQDVRLFRGLTVFENVEAASLSTGATRREARALAWELLARMQLEQRSGVAAFGLPHGESRRVSIARALATLPAVLILDEPAAGLNEAESAELVGALTAIKAASSLALLVIEHNMRLIMELSERIQVLDHGKTIAVGTPAEVRSDPAVLDAYLGVARGVRA